MRAVLVPTLLLALSAIVLSTHANVASGAPKPPTPGYWCWTHQDGRSAACAPEQEQCASSLAGYNQTATAAHGEPSTGACAWQKSAWQVTAKDPPPTPRILPTKAMCSALLSKGESCKEVH